jgi:hypothetical protein
MVDYAAQIDARLAADELLNLLSNPNEDVRLRACKGLACEVSPWAPWEIFGMREASMISSVSYEAPISTTGRQLPSHRITSAEFR